MVRTNVIEEDEGKPIVNSEGRRIGVVNEVQAGTAYVDADPDVTDTIRSKLGWGDASRDDYALQADLVESITDDEIRIKEDDLEPE